MPPPVISVENLSKRYLVGHREERGGDASYSLRDVMARGLRNTMRKALDVVRGQPARIVRPPLAVALSEASSFAKRIRLRSRRIPSLFTLSPASIGIFTTTLSRSLISPKKKGHRISMASHHVLPTPLQPSRSASSSTQSALSSVS